MTSLELLMKLTLTPGVSGFEDKIAGIMIEELGNNVSYQRDKLGSIAFEYIGKSSEPKIMVVGHQDEIGFITTRIEKNGLLRFHNLGGWDWRTLLSSPVNVINDKGELISGVIGSIPIHYIKGNLNELKLEEMFIDIGAKSDEDVVNKYGISPGSPIVPTTHFVHEEHNNLIFSKAFDDRVGIAIAIETGKFLSENDHANAVYCCGSVQEEVGIRGAQTLANMIKPDLAIVVEGVPADDFPGNESKAQNRLGGGAHIRLFDPTMLVKPKLTNLAIETAKKYDIPYQTSIRTSGGTDGKVIHISNIGVPTIVLGVPVRYAHSHNGIISLDDYKNCLELVRRLVMALDIKTYKEILS
ncbi:MAG: M42 family metallopeptidase [Candidatus Cloacimonetes bacterium]|nr:M42 family metallopeptidase [Candidatus Cloacimonadota bacterium]